VEYNYKRFRPSNYDLTKFDGPKAGETANLDFDLYSLAGESANLDSYKGKWLVIETASLTCPMYVKNVKGMSGLIEKYPDVEFVTLYIREAHPGSIIVQANSQEEKIDLAKRTKETYNDPRVFFVDTVNGDLHQAYGSMANMVYIINPDGIVVYRSDWAFTKRIEKVLNNRDEIHANDHVQIWGAPAYIMVPVVLRAGWIALWDMIVAIPEMAMAHFVADWENFRRRSSRPSPQK
jgi:glutathione peroxidase-family protein